MNEKIWLIFKTFQIHNSFSELHEALDKKVLPKEMGGEMPMAEMIGNSIFNVIISRVLCKYIHNI